MSFFRISSEMQLLFLQNTRFLSRRRKLKMSFFRISPEMQLHSCCQARNLPFIFQPCMATKQCTNTIATTSIQCCNPHNTVAKSQLQDPAWPERRESESSQRTGRQETCGRGRGVERDAAYLELPGEVAGKHSLIVSMCTQCACTRQANSKQPA